MNTGVTRWWNWCVSWTCLLHSTQWILEGDLREATWGRGQPCSRENHVKPSLRTPRLWLCTMFKWFRTGPASLRASARGFRDVTAYSKLRPPQAQVCPLNHIVICLYSSPYFNCFNQIRSTGIVINLDTKCQQRSTEILFDYFTQTVSGSINLACFRLSFYQAEWPYGKKQQHLLTSVWSWVFQK